MMFAKGITNDSYCIERALSGIREFMQDDGQESVYRRLIVPASKTVRFAKALGLVNEQEAEAILNYCEKLLDDR